MHKKLSTILTNVVKDEDCTLLVPDFVLSFVSKFQKIAMGIYVHIPFCRSKCYYCGFYSVASTQLKKAYIAALGH